MAARLVSIRAPWVRRLTLPELGSAQPVALGIMAIAVVLVFGLKWTMLRVLATCALLGAAAALIGLPVG